MGAPKHGQPLNRSGIGGPDDIMSHHTPVRDGEVWWCPRCKTVLGPFGAGMPQPAADCTPRTWGSGAA